MATTMIHSNERRFQELLSHVFIGSFHLFDFHSVPVTASRWGFLKGGRIGLVIWRRWNSWNLALFGVIIYFMFYFVCV